MSSFTEQCTGQDIRDEWQRSGSRCTDARESRISPEKPEKPEKWRKGIRLALWGKVCRRESSRDEDRSFSWSLFSLSSGSHGTRTLKKHDHDVHMCASMRTVRPT